MFGSPIQSSDPTHKFVRDFIRLFIIYLFLKLLGWFLDQAVELGAQVWPEARALWQHFQIRNNFGAVFGQLKRAKFYSTLIPVVLIFHIIIF